MTRLRQHLAAQSGASTIDAVTLPPALVSVLLPHISKAASSEGTGVASSSSTVNTALTQRVRILQEENDELYEMLKSGETGKLKEEVRGLRRVVERLEGALRGMRFNNSFYFNCPSHAVRCIRISPSNRFVVVSHFMC